MVYWWVKINRPAACSSASFWGRWVSEIRQAVTGRQAVAVAREWTPYLIGWIWVRVINPAREARLRRMVEAFEFRPWLIVLDEAVRKESC